MNDTIQTSALSACVLVAGCGGNGPSTSTEVAQGPLTAEELSRLLDLHTFKLPIPPAQQPLRTIRFVLIKPDGSVVGQQGMNSVNPEWYTGILLGIRFEHGAFAGNLEVTDAKGGRQGMPLTFASPLASCIRSWYGGQQQWEGNRIQVATVWDVTGTNHSGLPDADKHYSTLAVELVK